MIRRFELCGVLLIAAAIAAGACGGNPKPTPPTAGPAPVATAPPAARDTHSTAAATARASGSDARAADRRRDLPDEDARAAERGEAARRRVVQLRLDRPERRGTSGAAEERRVAEALEQHADHGGRARRLARHHRVQPGARRAPRRCGPRLPGQPRCPDRAHHDRQQGRRAAGLLRGNGRAAGSRTAAGTSSSPGSDGHERSGVFEQEIRRSGVVFFQKNKKKLLNS